MYLIDSNVLMEAHRQYYSFRVVPGFWQWIINAHSQGLVGSVRRVRDEINAGEDELRDWIKDLPAQFFAEEDTEVTVRLSELARWAVTSGYEQEITDKFLGSADLLLIAHAKADHHTAVSLESSKPNSAKHIQIPDVCKHFEIKCIRTFEMLADANVEFDLRSDSK